MSFNFHRFMYLDPAKLKAARKEAKRLRDKRRNQRPDVKLMKALYDRARVKTKKFRKELPEPVSALVLAKREIENVRGKKGR